MKISKNSFTAILILTLIIPWIARLYITEPYPAVMFPSGHGKISIVNDSISFERNQIYGVKNGVHEELHWDQLLGPIKPQYYSMLWMKELGFSIDWIKEDKEDVKLMPWKKRNKKDIQSLKDWYSDQLDDRYDSIVFKKFYVSVSMESGQETTSLLVYKCHKVK